jgi:hypothetical protein
MKFEVGKFYKTRDGRKAQLFILDNGASVMLGVVLNKGGIWFSNQWRCDGRIYCNNDTLNDLVTEWTEPKPPKLLAPALYYTGTEWILGRTLFESKKEAQEEHGDRQIIWPAIPNKDGMYEVPQ